MCDRKVEPANFLFELRAPLYGLQGYANSIFENDKYRKYMPPEGVVWLEKWAPKFDVWVTELSRLSHQDRGNLTLDQFCNTLIQQLMVILEGVETAAIEANGIDISDAQNYQFNFEVIKKAILDVDIIYQGMCGYLTSLEN
jgi:hypothetical protein